MSRRPAGAPAHAGVKRLAVLPFENLGSKEDDYFADGITDEVRGKLTNLPGLEVIARTSSNGYRKTQKKPQQIGKELDAEYLLTGAVRFAKGSDGTRRVQVSPELSLASSGASRWAQPFDATLTDVFQVQGEIATRVAQALDVALSAGEKRSLEAKSTQNLPAYEAYLRGEEASQSMTAADPPSLRRAVGHYEQAVALDPRFVEAWARLSRASSFHLRQRHSDAGRGRAGAVGRGEGAGDRAGAPGRPSGARLLLHARHQGRGPSASRDGAGAPPVSGQRGLRHFPRDHPAVPGTVGSVAGRSRRGPTPRSPLGQYAFGAWALRLSGCAATQSRGRPMTAGSPSRPRTCRSCEQKAMTYLAEGDLAGARAVLKAAPKEVDPTALVAFVANYADLVWVLDEAQRDLLLRLTPSAFDENRGVWAHCLAQASALKRDEPNVRKYAEIARARVREAARGRAGGRPSPRHPRPLARVPGKEGRSDPRGRASGGAACPSPGMRTSAPTSSTSSCASTSSTGENEKALDKLEPLLKIPYHLTPGWLEIDPNFDPLRQSSAIQEADRSRVITLVAGFTSDTPT